MNDWGSPRAMASLFSYMAAAHLEESIQALSDGEVENIMLLTRTREYYAHTGFAGLVVTNGQLHDAMQVELLWRQDRRENGSSVAKQD